MNTYKKNSILLLISFVSSSALAWSPFQGMKAFAENMQKMHEEMDKHFQELTVSNGINIDLNEQENAVEISLKGLETESVDASKSINDKDNEFTDLVINTDQGTATIAGHNNYLTVHWRQKKTKEKESFYGQQLLETTVSQSLDLKDSALLKLNYDKETKTLLITVPFIEVKKPARQNVPVIMNSKKQSKE